MIVGLEFGGMSTLKRYFDVQVSILSRLKEEKKIKKISFSLSKYKSAFKGQKLLSFKGWSIYL